MTLAARAIVELFRLVERESEVHQQTLAFSISHDHRSVLIYGCYPVIDGKDTKYYRHPIHTFDFTTLDGKEKWTAYRFTKNVYDLWMPAHLDRIRSAINQLPSGDFEVPSTEGTGLTQVLERQQLSQSGVGPAAPTAPKPQSTLADPQMATPDSSFKAPGSKRPKKTGQHTG
jgi:hypothetical protein